MQTPPDPLDSLLDRWRGATPDPSDRTESEVWRRIAAAERPHAVRPGILARMEAMFARPSFTAVFAAVCLLLGLFLAQVRVSRLEAQRNVHLVNNYLRLIDPLLESVDVTESVSGEHQP